MCQYYRKTLFQTIPSNIIYLCNNANTFFAGFMAHDPMVRKLPTRRVIDYSTRNRYQVTFNNCQDG